MRCEIEKQSNIQIVKAKAARSGYSQTSEQTHGLGLQGVGGRPRGLSRHEMVPRVMTPAGLPAGERLRSSLATAEMLTLTEGTDRTPFKISKFTSRTSGRLCDSH